MNGRVYLPIVFLFGGLVAFDLACQALSPYPSVYDQVYEAGSLAPQTSASATSSDASATEDATEDDGETFGDGGNGPTATCPTGATVFAAADNPQTITLDSTNAYWTNAPVAGSGTGTGSIAYLARGAVGGAPTTLAPKLTQPIFIANANGYVAWSDTGTVGLVSVATTTISTFPTASTMPGAGVAVGPTDAYWLSSSGGVITVQSAPVLGGSAVPPLGTVSTAFLPSGLSIQGNTLYFAAYANPSTSPGNGGAIYQIPIAGGTTPTAMQTFASGTPDDVVTDSNNIYWTDLYADGGSVFSMPLGGGTVTPMATTLGVPHYLAVDSNNIYTADFEGGSVYEIPLGTSGGTGGTGGNLKVLATGVGPIGVAADSNTQDNVVYFTSLTAICTVPK